MKRWGVYQDGKWVNGVQARDHSEAALEALRKLDLDDESGLDMRLGRSVIREKTMRRNPMDEAISALKVALVQTLGMSLSAVVALYLFSTDSRWFSVALMAAVIFAAIVWRRAPAIIQTANQRAKARHHYLH